MKEYKKEINEQETNINENPVWSLIPWRARRSNKQLIFQIVILWRGIRLILDTSLAIRCIDLLLKTQISFMNRSFTPFNILLPFMPLFSQLIS